MAQISSVGSSASAHVPMRRNPAKGRKQKTMGSNPHPFKITWSAIEVPATTLLNDDFEVGVAAMVYAIDLAKANAREEFLVINIAPDEPVGSSQVSEVQARLEEVISTAFSRTGRAVPEMRLSLRGHEYDLRLYIGRTKPTDFGFGQGH